MGRDDTRVEYRIDAGEWKPMQCVERPDPRLLAENVRDDEAPSLRTYDRAPEATPSPHLWRGSLPTDLPPGTHRIRVRAHGVHPQREFDEAEASYRLEDAEP